ncbi:MAG: putative O-glycosylation ligase, exosortase A system-associated [Xylophilus ampelinus]
MIFAAVCCLIPLSLRSATVAYLVWGWTALLTPVYYLYGFMQSFRFNFTFAVIAMGMLALGRVHERGVYRFNRTSLLLVIFVLHASLAVALAYQPNPSNGQLYVELLKLMTFCLLMPFFVNNRTRIHAMMAMIAIGLGLHGVVEGLKVLASGGGHRVDGIPMSKMSDNNQFAVGMVMALPVLLYLYQYLRNRWASLAAMGGLVLTVVAVLGTNSRGGFISMSVVGLWLIMTSRRKFLSLFVVLLAGGLILMVAPESWFHRMDSIDNAGQDGSFMGRVFAWKISSAIALQNPVFGGGLRAQQVYWIFERFKDAPSLISIAPEFAVGYAVAAHSIYFEILGDMGFVGLFIFLAIIANALVTRFEIKRLVKRLGPDHMWARDLTDMISVSVVAYAVGGAAVSLAYFEIFYMIVMLQEMLKQHLRSALAAARQDIAAPRPADPPSTAAVGGAVAASRSVRAG